MQFDAPTYIKFMEAADQTISRNLRQFSPEFGNFFMNCHALPHSGYNNDNVTFYSTVLNDIMSQTGGQPSFTTQQMYDAVGRYLNNALNFWITKQQQQHGGARYGAQPMGYGQPMYGQQPSSGLGSWQSAAQPPVTNYQPAPQEQPVTQQPVQQAQTVNVVPPEVFAGDDHPFADMKDANVDIAEQRTHFKDAWGGENPKNRTILVTSSKEVRPRGTDHIIRRVEAQHQVILDDPLDVVKDFFKAAPEALLSKTFIFRILYNHLSIIDVPTADFVKVRDIVRDALTQPQPEEPVYRVVIKALSSLSRGSWKAFSKYLVEAVNRALLLSARIADNPFKSGIELTPDASGVYSIDDLEDLLSSGFKHPLTAIPEGRTKLKKIVETAIWNALSMNSGALFTGDHTTYPTRMMIASPAFPFSLRHVYQDKTWIPDPDLNSQREQMGEFIHRMNKHELSEKTYIVSKRAVVVTNLLPVAVLNAITKTPQRIEGFIPGLFNRYGVDHLDHTLMKQDLNDYNIVRQTADGDAIVDKLAAYYTLEREERDQEFDADELPVNEKTSHDIPVDQFMVAVPFGSRPQEGLKSFDVLWTIDQAPSTGSALLVSHKLEQFKVI